MKTRQLIMASFVAVATAMGGSVVAKSVPGDGAKPIVELMPIVVRHEAVLDLSAEQIAAFDAFRKENMPARIQVQKEILDKRAELRTAILDGRSATERETLMGEIVDAEMRHLQGRDRCADFMRTTLSEAQYAEVVRLYLAALR